MWIGTKKHDCSSSENIFCMKTNFDPVVRFVQFYSAQRMKSWGCCEQKWKQHQETLDEPGKVKDFHSQKWCFHVFPKSPGNTAAALAKKTGHGEMEDVILEAQQRAAQLSVIVAVLSRSGTPTYIDFRAEEVRTVGNKKLWKKLLSVVICSWKRDLNHFSDMCQTLHKKKHKGTVKSHIWSCAVSSSLNVKNAELGSLPRYPNMTCHAMCRVFQAEHLLHMAQSSSLYLKWGHLRPLPLEFLDVRWWIWCISTGKWTIWTKVPS